MRWRADRPRVRALLLAAALLGLSGCAATHSASPAQAWVYVAGAGNEIRVLNATDLAVAGTLRVAGAPVAMAWDAAHARLWVAAAGADGRDGRLLALAGGTARVASVLELGFIPRALRIAGGGLWIAGRDGGGGVLARLDLASGQRRRMRLGRDPVALATSPAGTMLVADAGDRALYLVDARRLAPRARVPLAAAPAAVVALPYGHKAFVLCPAIAQVAAVDLARAGVLAYLQVGADPRRMALKPDGGELYVSSFAAGTVSAIDTGANQVTDVMQVGRAPLGLAVSADDQWLYVANSGSNTVQAISIDDRRIVAAIAVGMEPSDLELDGAGDLLFVEDRGSSDIGVIRTGPRNLLSLLPAAPNPTAMRVAQ